MAAGTDVSVHYNVERAAVIVCARRRFLQLRRRPSPLRAAVRGAPAAGRRRAAGSTRQRRCRSTTGAKADHRLPLKPSEIELLARALAADLGVAGVNRGAALPADAQAWLAAVRNDLNAHRGSSIVVAGEGQPPVVHALAHAMNAALGNAGQTVLYTDSVEPHPVDQVQSIRELDGGDGRRTGGHAAHHRRQSGLHRARRSAVRRADEQGSGARAPEPARERDVGDLALADSGSALSRGMERRARVRRHGVDRAAAHRAALRRPLRARSARHAERSPRAHGISDRAGILDRCECRCDGCNRCDGCVRCDGCARSAPVAPAAPTARRCRVRNILAAHRARRRDGEHRPADARDHACRPDCRVRRGARGRASGIEIAFRPDPDDPRRPVQQQRLAAGAAEAAHPSHVGQRGARQPRNHGAARRNARAPTSPAASADRFTARSSRFAIAAEPCRARCSPSPAIRTMSATLHLGYGRARTGHVGRRARLQRRRAENVGCARLRHRRADRADGRRRFRSRACSITT